MTITEQELLSAWPEEPADQHVAEVRETLFSGLEHLPGTVVNGEWRLNPDWWRNTPEYDDIEAYVKRFRSGLTD